MQISSRSSWGALPPTRPLTPWNVANLEGICQHWFGIPKAAATHAGCDDLLRSVQRTHQNHPTEDYPDIAYNLGACPHGVAYELRGWNFRTGANGSTEANGKFLAIVYMAGTGDPLTAKGQAALEALYAEAFRRGVAVNAITHGSITGSECPGPAVKKWLASGAWKPNQPAPVKYAYVIYNADDPSKVLARSADVSSLEKPRKTRLGSWLSSEAIVNAIDAEFEGDKPGTPRDVLLRRVKA